jgi:3-deoxy-D-manno-octulosonate 8-phosphate phosphatase (KDO 8-P phosphatase)
MSEQLKTAQQRAVPIKLAIFDVDGVMTDGRLYFGDDGQEFKAFHSLDGHGLKMLKQSGVALAIITGRTSQVVIHRARNLGIELLYQGVSDKRAAFQTLLAQTGLDAKQAAYMGDDVVDLPVMLHCGLAITVPEAPKVVVQAAHWVSTRAGGMGAVREACELIMQAQGTWDRLLASYLQ